MVKYCSVCLYQTKDNANWQKHVNSKKHINRC